MTNYRLICTKDGLDKAALFGADHFHKIFLLTDDLFKKRIMGNFAPSDLDSIPLKVSLHNALDIKLVPSPISLGQGSSTRFGSKYNYFYVVRPGAVEELMLQKLQDNPALRTDYVSKKPITPARIMKLSENWHNQWLIAQIISQGLDGDLRPYSNIVKVIIRELGSGLGWHLIETARNRVIEIVKTLPQESRQYIHTHDIDNTSIELTTLQIKNNVLALD